MLDEELVKLWQARTKRLKQFDEKALTHQKPTNEALLAGSVNGQIDPLFRLMAKKSLAELSQTLKYLTNHLAGAVWHRPEYFFQNANKEMKHEDIAQISEYLTKVIEGLENCYLNYFIVPDTTASKKGKCNNC